MDTTGLAVQMLPPETLTPYANNVKKHPIAQIDKIAQQIAKFGFDQPIVVDGKHVIIKGHGRREAALRLGLKEVPVVVRDDLDEYQAMAARIGDNKVAESDVDKDMLAFELGTLQRQDFDLNLTGFELKEVEEILIVDEYQEAPSAAKSGPAKEKPEPGEVHDVTDEVVNAPAEELPQDENAEEQQGTEDAPESQRIVSVYCKSEEEMQALFEELSARGLEVRMIQ